MVEDFCHQQYGTLKLPVDFGWQVLLDDSSAAQEQVILRAIFAPVVVYINIWLCADMALNKIDAFSHSVHSSQDSR